jgi:hypothetical protein
VFAHTPVILPTRIHFVAARAREAERIHIQQVCMRAAVARRLARACPFFALDDGAAGVQARRILRSCAFSASLGSGAPRAARTVLPSSVKLQKSSASPGAPVQYERAHAAAQACWLRTSPRLDGDARMAARRQLCGGGSAHATPASNA